MKWLPWTLAVLLLIMCVAAWFRPQETKETIRTETKIKTIVKVDTLLITPPMAVLFRFTSETIRIGDTIVNREQAVYKDSFYRAVVSGYKPRLDSMEVYPRTVTREITNDVYYTIIPPKKHWGIGLQAGYGYPNGLYVGVGVSYNIW